MHDVYPRLPFEHDLFNTNNLRTRCFFDFLPPFHHIRLISVRETSLFLIGLAFPLQSFLCVS
jgi:hypothetical protein